MNDEPKQVKGVVGRVDRAPFGTGSKSQRDAVVIDTREGRYVLRRKNGPAMGDKALDRYVGCRVRCDGVMLSHTLIAEYIEVID